MATKDIFHDAVKSAIEEDSWTILVDAERDFFTLED
ncbi:MAG: element excision factor XisH family protein [Cyanobacteria bacterium J06635_15]